MAAWIASEKIIVGVTGARSTIDFFKALAYFGTKIIDDVLLANKSNKEVLEDFPTRAAKVTSFLSLFRPGIIYDVVPIVDVYGPTAWEPNIQALVVSRETMSGSAASEYTSPDSMPAG